MERTGRGSGVMAWHLYSWTMEGLHLIFFMPFSCFTLLLLLCVCRFGSLHAFLILAGFYRFCSSSLRAAKLHRRQKRIDALIHQAHIHTLLFEKKKRLCRVLLPGKVTE
ncbi:hypothetical protein J3E69DRAFT_210217 [Trichoderma sp. SZMC 28015]